MPWTIPERMWAGITFALAYSLLGNFVPFLGMLAINWQTNDWMPWGVLLLGINCLAGALVGRYWSMPSWKQAGRDD